MRLIDELDAEHELIDRLAGSLLGWSVARGCGSAPVGEVADYAAVLSVLVCGWHHEREETLIQALIREAEVPAERGPIPVLRDEHREIAGLVRALKTSGGIAPEPVRRLVRLLWEHVDKERSVLLPEAAARLTRAAVRELPTPAPGPEVEEAFALARVLVSRRPPVDDPEVIRGDGCICCSAFAVRCGGIETEWWTTWERLHHRSLDEG